MLGSLFIKFADELSVPGGGAFAVDRVMFSKKVNELIENHPNIEVMHQEVIIVPMEPRIIALGPLASARL
jgi:methylenetetrahydrofolate--tRNA-(uracil-5-)-methyltransferase